MNERQLYNFIWIPIFLIGLTMIILGPRWMIVDEPWLLDKKANEETLGISFNALFSANVNTRLPDYLRTIYRFFGLWLTGLGFMVCAYTQIAEMRTKKSRYTILAFVGLLLGVSLYLGHTRIPSSPFIYLMWALVVIYLISLIASIRFNRLPG